MNFSVTCTAQANRLMLRPLSKEALYPRDQQHHSQVSSQLDHSLLRKFVLTSLQFYLRSFQCWHYCYLLMILAYLIYIILQKCCLENSLSRHCLVMFEYGVVCVKLAIDSFSNLHEVNSLKIPPQIVPNLTALRVQI